MRRLLSTRHGFFAFAAVMCWALIPVIDAEFRWVTIATGALYAVLCVLFLAEEISRSTREPTKPPD